jgi:2-polyprenyl-6-methoxyphenol hydroxylase-like FAD-dependent oxidoreductase
MAMADGPLQVAVAGGSIGGLCAGLALQRIAGAEVDIYERQVGEVETRGAGIVVQPELTQLLRLVDAAELPTTGCEVRRYLEPDGGEGSEQVMPQRFTSWEAIFQTLRGAFPDGRYHVGAALGGFDTVCCLR